MLTLEQQSLWVTARCKEKLTKGRHYFEIKRVRSTENAFLLGVVNENFTQNTTHIEGENGWAMYVEYGDLYHINSECAPYCKELGATNNWTIGLLIDMDLHTLAFVVNGEYEGVAFNNLSGAVSVAISSIHVLDAVMIHEPDNTEWKKFIWNYRETTVIDLGYDHLIPKKDQYKMIPAVAAMFCSYYVLFLVVVK
jgi:hypothetical protein